MAMVPVRPITKEAAERELGVLIKETTNGMVMNDANIPKVSISIEFSCSGDLDQFRFAQMDIYIEPPSGSGRVKYRRLFSTRLKPSSEAKEKMFFVFSTDKECLDRTFVTLYVPGSGIPGLKGYQIRL
jgi:hypothetical protein